MRRCGMLCVGLLLIGLTACAAAEPTPFSVTTPGGTWDLVWSDEFDYEDLPDPEKWGYEVGFIRNNELQYYTEAREENARVEDGVLIIEARKDIDEVSEEVWMSIEARMNSDDPPDAIYTSASLHTKDTATWTYGRIEVRAQLPQGVGTWPAIWMLGVNIDEVGWPACGEIDIMEHVGFAPGLLHGSVHTEAYNHVAGTNKGGRLYRPDPYADFHIYAIEWFEDRIDFYIDEYKYFTFKNEHTGVETWPYAAPHYLILNLAIGGSWGGLQGVDDNIFPQPYFIDYVRVFEHKE